MPKSNENLIAQIAKSKERSSEWPRGVAYLARLMVLRNDLDGIPAEGNSFLWYLPVALVGCIEAFLKESFARLIDSGSPYLERVTALKTGQLRLEDLILLQDRRVSLGEFVAQQQSYSSIEALNRTASTLCADDFLASLKEVQPVMPWQRRPPSEPVLQDPGNTYEQLKECFRLRHLVCHEGPPREPLPPGRAHDLHAAVENFLLASFYWFARLLLQHVPATHQERKEARLSEAQHAAEEMEDAVSSLAALLPAERRELLSQSQTAWEKFADLDATLAGSTYASGLMESEERLRWQALHRRDRVQALNAMKELAER